MQFAMFRDGVRSAQLPRVLSHLSLLGCHETLVIRLVVAAFKDGPFRQTLFAIGSPSAGAIAFPCCHKLETLRAWLKDKSVGIPGVRPLT